MSLCTLPLCLAQRRSWAASVLIIGVQLNCFGQLSEPTLINPIPSLPTAEALGAYGNIPDVRVAVYTHNSVIGITSITGNNNVMSYYEYDSLGRLETIRDFEENIVKHYKYHYQNED